MKRMTLDIRILTAKEVLGGSIQGRQLLGQLIEHAADDPDFEVCVLDFSRIQLATASYLRESVLAFQRWGIDRRFPFSTVLANVNSDVLEELELVLTDCGGAIWVCTLGKDDKIGDSKAIGKFDEIQRQTFELVRSRGEVDAPTLAREDANGTKVNQTAWNNRLAALASRGLLLERRRNKTKIYRLVLEV